MQTDNRQFIWILVLLLAVIYAVPCVFAYEEGIHLFRPDSMYIQDSYSVPEFLSVEDLTFFTCIEDDTLIKSSVICLDNNNFEDVEVTKWMDDENCFMGSFNLEGFKCKHLRLQSEYIKNNENIKLTKNLRVNKFTSVLDKLVDTQYSDGGWKDSLSTASSILALSHFKDIYDVELDKALDWLKLNRNNNEKCWPKNKCSVTKTANILAYLTLSEYNDTRRIINDGRNWLQEKQNYFEENDDWTITIKDIAEGTTLVLVSYEKVILDENFTIPINKTKNYTIEAKTDKELLIISDENTQVNITNKDGDNVYEYHGDNLSYVITGPCWSPIRKGEVCDKVTTGYALFTDLPEDYKERGVEWMRDHLERSKLFGKYFGTDEDNPLQTALYIYTAYDEDVVNEKKTTNKKKDDKKTQKSEIEEENDMVTNWLLIKQNNEGSWGTGKLIEKLIPTATSVMALMKNGFNRTAESIEDAEEWVSDNEEKINKSSTQELSMAFFVLRNNARPLLISIPGAVEITKSNYELELQNPTTFKLNYLEYEFSDNLKDILEIETRQVISAYSYRKLTITKKSSTQNDIYGYLSITNINDEIARIPIVVSDFPMINVTTKEADESTTVFGKTGEVQFDVGTVSKHSFTCSIDWDSDDIEKTPNFRIQKEGKQTVKITFTKAESIEDIYKGTLKCNARGQSYSFPVNYHITRYSAIPFTIFPKNIIVNSSKSKPTITIENNLDEDIFLTAEFNQPQDMFSIENKIMIRPNEQKNISISTSIKQGMNVTGSYMLKISALDHTETITITAVVIYEPQKKLSLFFIIILTTIITFVFAGSAYLIYRFREQILEFVGQYGLLKSFESKKKIRTRVKKVKEIQTEDKNLAIINLVQILQFKKTSDEEISKRLLAEGFSPEEIKKALEKSGIILEGIEELLAQKEQKGKKKKESKKAQKKAQGQKK